MASENDGGREPKLVVVYRYRDADGQPVCQRGRDGCEFLLPGPRCFYVGSLTRRSGRGDPIPGAGCPLWS